MKCLSCGYGKSKVIDSRGVGDGIRRRRQCLKCAARFTTYEHLQSRNLFVIKKDNRREEFNREKLLSGIRKACEKCPLPTGTINKVVDSIEAELYHLGKVEVPSSIIGDIVMKNLKKLDHIAYIRFASVYREFTDITALKREVDTLVDTEAKTPSASQLPLLSQEELTVLNQRRRRHK